MAFFDILGKVKYVFINELSFLCFTFLMWLQENL